MNVYFHYHDEISFVIILFLRQYHMLLNILKEIRMSIFYSKIRFYLDHNVNYHREEKLDKENVYLHQNNQFVRLIQY
jgi:hypothetical protein